MTTNFKVQDHHILQFTRNVELLLQQKCPRLAGTTATGSYQGDKAQAVIQFGEVDMAPITDGENAGNWKGDTVWSSVDHYQRWVFPSDFAVSLPLSRQDQIRMFGDPRSPYAEAVRAAYARKVDDIIIAAATGEAKTGKYDDLRSTAFPSEQVMEHGGKGLTIDKLIDAKEMLLAAGNDPSEERFIACSEKQLSDLLKSTEVKSADYNTIKALVKGEIDTFVGFKFISTERLAMTPVNGSVPQLRHCFAWVKSGLHFGTWDALNIRADARPDKNYVWQVYARATIGATRTQEKKVIQIDCKE